MNTDTMLNPSISIIVPVYNAERTIRKCIDSILCQSFTDFEILLVDDGSKDGSLSICNEYSSKDQRIRVFHKENGGASSARNLGLEEMRGEWVTFCDSDDFVGADWLDSFFRYAVPDVDLVVQGHKLVRRDIECKQISEKDITIEAKTGCDILARNNQFGYTQLKLFRSSVIHTFKLHFDKRFWLKEDELFVLSYLPHVNKIAFSSKCEYYYVNNDDSLKYIVSGEVDKQFDLLAEQMRVIVHFEDFYANGIVYDRFLRRFTYLLLEKYTDRRPDCYDCLRQYRRIVGNGVGQIRDASIVLKIMFSFPVPVCHLLLMIHSFFKRLRQ